MLELDELRSAKPAQIVIAQTMFDIGKPKPNTK